MHRCSAARETREARVQERNVLLCILLKLSFIVILMPQSSGIGGVNMVGDLVFFLLGAWVGACFAVLVLSLLAGASETAPPSRFDRIEIDRVSDCV